MASVRPLKKISPGLWVSATEDWRFARHSNARPHRWFAYGPDGRVLDQGYFSLGAAAKAVEALLRT